MGRRSPLFSKGDLLGAGIARATYSERAADRWRLAMNRSMAAGSNRSMPEMDRVGEGSLPALSHRPRVGDRAGVDVNTRRAKITNLAGLVSFPYQESATVKAMAKIART